MTGSAAMRVVVVVAVLAGSLALDHAPAALVNKILHERAMAQQRSTHWGVNLTTVSEGEMQEGTG